MTWRDKLGKIHDGIDESGTEFLRITGPLRVIEAIIKLPGLFVVQYLFFWNWKRIVDPDTWQVILVGLATYGLALLIAVVMVRYS